MIGQPYNRQRMFLYWIVVLLGVVMMTFLTYTIIDSATARHDADKQLSSSRASATRRIDLLTKQIQELQQRNIELERANAALTERGK